MRESNVVRFMPNRAAAPEGPLMTHFDSCNTRRMCARSTSLRLEVVAEDPTAGIQSSSVSGTCKVGPFDRMTARSIKF